MSHTPSRAGRTHAWRGFGVAMAACGLGLIAAAYAAAPPAGTAITNQATASYKDNTGAQQTSTSNTVVTTVSQVGSFTLTPNGDNANTKSAAAGATVYTAYTLTNTGNGTDTFKINAAELSTSDANFSKIELYLDNGAGLPASTTPLCTFAANSCEIAAQSVAGGDAFKFVVAYSMPTSATPTWTNQAKITVQPSNTLSSWYSTYATTSAYGTDTVNLTTAAAFSVGKAIAAPAVASATSTWPVLTSGIRGTTTTYTLSYANNGAAAANLYIKDTLPGGFDYVDGSAVVSCGGGIGLASDGSNGTSVCASTGGVDFKFDTSTRVLEAVIRSVPAISNGTLSFKVTVANTAAIGTADTSNTAYFTPEGCSAGNTVAACTVAGTPPTGLSATNTAAFTVMASRGVTFNVVDDTANSGTPSTVAGDTITSGSIVPGGYVRQLHKITNTGNSADTFNLSTSADGFPSGTTFKWFSSSDNTLTGNLTPQLDTNGDGTIDTGEIAIGQDKYLVLQITVPSTTPIGNPNYAVTLTAASVYDLGIRDATKAVVQNVISGWVDVQNTDGTGVGPGPTQAPEFTTPTIVAGSAYSEIALKIVNNETSTGTYYLQYNSSSSFPSPATTQGNLPAGWDVKFSTSACPVATPGSPLPAVTNLVTLPLSVAASSNTTVYACVSAPLTASTTTQPVYIKVTKDGTASDGSTPSDVIYDAVSVAASNELRMTLSANGSGNVAKGNNVTYAHTVTNSGTQSCAAGAATNYLRVNASLPTDKLNAGWTATLYADNDDSGTLSAGDTVITDNKLPIPAASQGAGNVYSLASGKSAKLLVYVQAPGGANAGDTALVTVTVEDVNASGVVQTYPNGCGSQTNFDTTTVVTGSLSVVKTQETSAGTCSATFPGSLSAATRSAKPGDCIYYQVVASNNGATPVTNVSLSDAVPAYTTLSAQTPNCAATGLDQAIAFSNGNGVLTCSSASANTLQPGGTVTLKFSVQINSN